MLIKKSSTATIKHIMPKKVFCLLACKEVPGYYGSFCNFTCPSGSYGVDCAGDCTSTCLYYQCHHVYGCLKNITDQITTIASGNECLLIIIEFKRKSMCSYN